MTPLYPFHWYLSLKAADGVTLATRYICNCRAWQVLYVERMYCFLYFFFFFFFKFLSSEAELTIKFWNCHIWICRFPLPLGVWEGLRLVIVALPGLFSYLFFFMPCFNTCFTPVGKIAPLSCHSLIRYWMSNMASDAKASFSSKV